MATATGKQDNRARSYTGPMTLGWRARNALVLLCSLPGCADVWGFQDLAVESDDGSSPDGMIVVDDATVRVDGGKSGVEDAEPSLDGGADGIPGFDAGNCGVTMVDTVQGVFVASGGMDSSGCGTEPNSPCASIGAGIATATANARGVVYVSAGTYVERLTLPAGISVQGGWHWGGNGGTEWAFDCSATPESVVTVQAPSSSNMTVVANSNNGSSTLSTLTVLSKPAAAVSAGESLYGIFATGANTQLTLTDVVVTMQAGGAGTPGSMGSAGAAPASTCSSGDGVSPGMPGFVGTAGLEASVSSTGFATHTGGTGGNGTPGDNGMAGSDATSVSYSACVHAPPACTSGQAMCTGTPGVNGCGGGGGLGGTGGAGGGSSVAIFADDATVTVTAGVLQAGNGGNGGGGGGGSFGVSGSVGANGQDVVCPNSMCASASSCTVTGSTTSVPGGAAGGAGGQGSNGGQGGGGSGGDSYAILTGGMATGRLTLSASSQPELVAGQPGLGGGSNGPNGTAGAENTF
jgi:hypothetical protein